MKFEDNALDYLKANEHKGNGAFRKEAQYLKDNWDWLKYSFAIAIKVRNRMEELGWTQKRLAEALSCTQQHVSVLLNGKVNMTLETLAKLEKALQFNLIGESLAMPPVPSAHSAQVEVHAYLNDPATPEDAPPIETASQVEGYKPRKKKGPRKK